MNKIIENALRNERKRQEENIELIASENYVSNDILKLQGSILTNKYAEGYPGKRYYGGCENVDVIEELAINYAKDLFKAEFANVQPHSGSSANMAVYRALEICVAAYQACHYLGVPECNVHLTHAAVYLALAPKSNALEVAYNNAKSDALKTLDQPVPLHIRNAPTKLMKDLGYSKGYEYSHDYEYHMTDMQCLPDALVGKEYYVPSDQGSEVKVRNRLAQIKQIKAMVHRNRMMKKK